MTHSLTRLRGDLTATRARRAAVRRLHADLAQFGTTAERAELAAVLARHDDAETEQIRQHASLVG